MKTVIDDIKAFLHEHRSTIYFVVVLLVIDHFFLGDRLTGRIKALAEKLLGAVEKKVDTATASTDAPITSSKS